MGCTPGPGNGVVEAWNSFPHRLPLPGGTASIPRELPGRCLRRSAGSAEELTGAPGPQPRAGGLPLAEGVSGVRGEASSPSSRPLRPPWLDSLPPSCGHGRPSSLGFPGRSRLGEACNVRTLGSVQDLHRSMCTRVHKVYMSMCTQAASLLVLGTHSICLSKNTVYFSFFDRPRSIWSSQPWLRPKPRLQQCRILNPLCQAGDQTCVPVLPRRHGSPCATVRTPRHTLREYCFIHIFSPKSIFDFP